MSNLALSETSLTRTRLGRNRLLAGIGAGLVGAASTALEPRRTPLIVRAFNMALGSVIGSVGGLVYVLAGGQHNFSTLDGALDIVGWVGLPLIAADIAQCLVNAVLFAGLMRVVNMAHGSLYLLGGYLALEMQESWFAEDTGLGLSLSGASDAEYGFVGWFVPLIIASVLIGVIGVLIQQIFLRWNQGQDLRQALITIALSVILADQMLAAFGGISKDIQAPSAWPTRSTPTTGSTAASSGCRPTSPAAACSSNWSGRWPSGRRSRWCGSAGSRRSSRPGTRCR